MERIKLQMHEAEAQLLLGNNRRTKTIGSVKDFEVCSLG